MENVAANVSSRSVLVTDLDGTLIPLAGCEQHESDLRTLGEELRANDAILVFSSGRHFGSVLQAIDQFLLPTPDWIICDVGTSIFRHSAESTFEPLTSYASHLAEIVSGLPIGDLRTLLRDVDGLQFQEDEKQGPFKLSFYTAAETMRDQVQKLLSILNQHRAPYSIVHSIDPFNGDGLIDLLPKGASKAYALAQWCQHVGLPADGVVFAGDSGNDLAALTSGCRAILVGNADRGLARRVAEIHRKNNWPDRLYLADGSATTGVLEGCYRFGVIPDRRHS